MHPVGALKEGKEYNNPIHNKYSKINSLITEIICTSTGVCPLC
jgi:hypothetical protein